MAHDHDSTRIPPLRVPLDESRLRRTLVGDHREGFYTRLDVVDETASTNADLLAAGASGEDRAVLLAEYQGHGRGRHSRTWNGVPHAQVIVSIRLRLQDCPLDVLGWLPLLTGIATVDTARAAGVPAELKWPNDVLVDGRKVAGILVEVAGTTPDPVVVVGVGLNVTLTDDELPVPTATSLLLEHADELDRTVLTEMVLTRFADRIRGWVRAGWDTAALAAEYRERCVTIGQHVRALLPGDTELRGIAEAVDERGCVVIRPDDGGEPVPVAAGDITHLRPLGG